MATFYIIIFVLSLVSITVLVGRKMAILRSGGGAKKDEPLPHPFFPDWEKVFEFIKKSSRRYGYVATVAFIRLYVRSSNLTREKSREITEKLLNLINRKKNGNGAPAETHEVNKFLKMVAEYKEKIRRIKHRVHEEEKNS